MSGCSGCFAGLRSICGGSGGSSTASGSGAPSTETVKDWPLGTRVQVTPVQSPKQVSKKSPMSRPSPAPGLSSPQHLSPYSGPADGSSTGGNRGKEGYRCFLLDMDGVLQRFGNVVPGAIEWLTELRTQNVPFVIMTNEDRYTNANLLAKLQRLMGPKVGLEARHLFTAANSCGLFFQKMMLRGWRGSVYMTGEEGLLLNLRERVAEFNDPRCKVLTLQEPEEEGMYPVAFVVVGSVYSSSAAGGEYLRSLERCSKYAGQGARVVCSCPDDYEVTEKGDICLGSPGLTVAGIQKVVGKSSYPLGKPNPHMVRWAWSTMLAAFPDQSTGLNFEDALFVGDSLNTDIRTALEHGIDSALVLSGCTTPEMLEASALIPTFVYDSIADIHAAFKANELHPSSVAAQGLDLSNKPTPITSPRESGTHSPLPPAALGANGHHQPDPRDRTGSWNKPPSDLPPFPIVKKGAYTNGR